jgi:serine/threonine protein kinase
VNPYDLVGQNLGDYKIERKIATGGMATIYLGVDEKLGRQAAVKVLTPDVSSRDETLTSRFEKEARAIAKLEHPHIIPIYQFGKVNALYFLAMRFVEGDDLSNVLDEYQKIGKLMPFDRALNILGQVADALDFAHSKGIIHRDIKPSNVLLSKDDRAYLSDFGLVLYQSGDQTLGTAFGTPRYISPEQATDSVLANPQSDIYSLAVIVYEMVTGQRLFKGKTPMEIALSHITEAPLPPRAVNPNISADIQNIILKSLEKEPTNRHKTAKLFIDELRLAYAKTEKREHPSLDETMVDTESDRSLPSTLAFKDNPKTPTGNKTPIFEVAPTSEDLSPTLTPLPGERPQLKPSTIERPLPSKPTPESKPASANKLLPIAIGFGIVAVFAVGILLALNGNNNNAVTPTNDGNDTTTVITNTNGLTLRYNDGAIALVNTSQSDIGLAGIRIEADGGAFVPSDSGLPAGLATETCLLLKSNAGNVRVPDEWGCDGAREIVLNQSTLFWRADTSDDDLFIVEIGDVRVTCQTAGRAVNRLDPLTCAIS